MFDYSSKQTPFNDFKQLLTSCMDLYENKKESPDPNILERRRQLAYYIIKFHSDSKTLTPAIKEKISAIREESTILIMAAHQPNLFPYSGVLRKATLLSVLQKELEQQLGVEVVSYFGIADQDFADDRWVKSSILPSITRREGIFTLNTDLPEKITLNNLQKPSQDTMKIWKKDIKTWLQGSTSSIKRFCLSNDVKDWSSIENIFQNNYELFWGMVEEAYESAITYSDFNSYVMSKIVNDVWQYDTLFSRFSESQKIFSNEFNFLLTNINDYSNSLKEVIQEIYYYQNSGGVSQIEPEYLPFWYHCDCGSKVRLKLRIIDNYLIGHGSCLKCNKEYDINLGRKDHPDISAISSNISAKAIPMILIYSKGLDLLCYVGGVGGKEYLHEADHVAKKMNINLPTIGYWRPHDLFISIDKLEALFEFERICGNYKINEWKNEINLLKSKIQSINYELSILEIKKNSIIKNRENGHVDAIKFKEAIKIVSDEINNRRKNSNLNVLQYNLRELNNIPFVFTCIPSIISYAINIGLKETSDQWVNYLINDGSLSSNISMKSIFDDLENTKLSYLFDQVLLLWNGLYNDKDTCEKSD